MMHAMLLEQQKQELTYTQLKKPVPNANEILIKIKACGICRTDLHVLDGELKNPKLPLIPGHQIVGVIEQKGENVDKFSIGERVGVSWLGKTCGSCSFCLSDRENLCDQPTFTGYQIDGGFSQYCVADSRFCFSIPSNYSDEDAAPLLCAGLVGYRALSKTGNAKHLGIYGFGSAAHIVIQIARHQNRKISVFTKPGDVAAQEFAYTLGATFAGGTDSAPKDLLDGAIIFAPAGELVPLALQHTAKGGIIVCGGIHMSNIPSFPYEMLWGERTICSIANLTRKDGEEFLALAPQIPIKTEVHTYPLKEANSALDDLRYGRFTGSAVVCP